jgi:ABC-type proline/glycine betaine transport system ATPase subunit
LEEAKKQAEEAQRDDCTVLVSRIHLQVDEKELYLFLAKAGVGKIRDIKMIRDSRSGKSKG